MSNKLQPSGSVIFRLIKRSFDIICSIILLIPIGVVVAISSVAIKLDDGGPVFYLATRTGRFGKEFKMFKLRSMKVNAPDIRLSDGSTFNGENDPRVTKFGKFARKTSIDELPQVINVLIGDMSFIGPRPDTPIGTASYTDQEKNILTVRPGITGYNQAVNRNSVLTKEKLKNDLYYVEHISLAFDIRIMFMTIATVLFHKNINRADVNVDDAYVLEDDGTKTVADIK